MVTGAVRKVDKFLEDVDELRIKVVRLKEMGYLDEVICDEAMDLILKLHEIVRRYIEKDYLDGHVQESTVDTRF